MTVIRNGSKWTISTSGRLGLLQMVSKSDTELFVSEDNEPPRGMDCEIPYWLERGTKHSLKGVETSP